MTTQRIKMYELVIDSSDEDDDRSEVVQDDDGDDSEEESSMFAKVEEEEEEESSRFQEEEDDEEEESSRFAKVEDDEDDEEEEKEKSSRFQEEEEEDDEEEEKEKSSRFQEEEENDSEDEISFATSYQKKRSKIVLEKGGLTLKGSIQHDGQSTKSYHIRDPLKLRRLVLAALMHEGRDALALLRRLVAMRTLMKHRLTKSMLGHLNADIKWIQKLRASTA
jgi:hypothetical protein